MRNPSLFLAISDFILLFPIWMESSSGSTNLALLRPATASHGSGAMGPGRAVDGLNITAIDAPNNLFCTLVDSDSVWWQVDLQVTVRVGSVRITPAEYGYALPHDFELVIYPDPKCPSNPQLCFEHSGRFQKGVAKTIFCSTPVRGRFVRLMQKDPVILCEVEVYEIENQSHSQGVIFNQTPEKKIDLTLPVLIETRSSIDCARLCLELGSCPAFNFRRESRACEISSSGNSSGLTTGNLEWDVYEQDQCLDI